MILRIKLKRFWDRTYDEKVSEAIAEMQTNINYWKKNMRIALCSITKDPKDSSEKFGEKIIKMFRGIYKADVQRLRERKKKK